MSLPELKNVVVVAFITVVIKYIVVQWFADQLGHFMHWLLVKTERDIIIWTHYQKHVMRNGHKPKTPGACQDDKCQQF